MKVEDVDLSKVIELFPRFGSQVGGKGCKDLAHFLVPNFRLWRAKHIEYVSTNSLKGAWVRGFPLSTKARNPLECYSSSK